MPGHDRFVRRPVVHFCVTCGKSACFGYGVSLLKSLPGKWYCFEHRPTEPVAPDSRPRDLFGKAME